MDSDIPKMSATFVPGAVDDFTMPIDVDLAAPAPQKVEEQPVNIQESLKRMNLDADGGLISPPPAETPANDQASDSDYIDLAALPKLTNRTPNIPPSDEEKGKILDNARVPVLGSSDPEVQLVWAQDALAYVDIHADNDAHGPPARKLQMEQLRADAKSIVEFLADQQHPRALFQRGMWLEFGKHGLETNKAEAFRSYRRAAERGYSRAEYRMGMQYESTNESMKALQHYKAGEAVGDSAACYRMGMTSLLGQLGQPQDFERAVQLIRYAADTADENAPQGAFVYGMLLCGELPQVKLPPAFLPADHFAGKQYLERAAFLGFSKAQLKIASAYELSSLGCDFNPSLSLHYNLLAAMQGEADAQMALSRWFLCGSEPTFSKDEPLAYKFAHLAAKGESVTAEFALGYYHEVGVSVPVDLVKAREWYEKAAIKGNAEAAARIEGISMARTLSKKDHETVAISRIKSTHASQRGSRPERLERLAASMPSIPDEGSRRPSAAGEPVSKPDLAVPPLNVNAHRPTSAMSMPPIPPVATPPVSTLPPRPATIAPYPAANAYPPQPLPHPPYPPYDDPRGRPINLPAPNVSRPQRSHSPSPGAAPIARRRAASNLLSTSPNLHPAHPGPPPPPKAPLQLVDPPVPDYARPPDARRQITPPGQRRPMAARTGPSPSNLSSTPPNVGQYPRARTPDLRNHVAGQINGRGTPPDPHGAAKPSVPPKKKGPQTFEEMGVPLGKQDSDCLVM